MKADADAAFQRQIAKHPEDAKAIALQRAVSNPPAYIDSFEVRGPYNAVRPPLPESYRRIFACGHLPGQHNSQCARTNLTQFARLAYRRPVTGAEVDRVVGLVK